MSDDGTFTTAGKDDTKLAYGGMLNLRIGIIYSVHSHLAQQSTIAARYASKRKQGFSGKDGSSGETAVINY